MQTRFQLREAAHATRHLEGYASVEDVFGENCSRRGISFEESMAEFGITQSDLDAADDLGIE